MTMALRCLFRKSHQIWSPLSESNIAKLKHTSSSSIKRFASTTSSTNQQKAHIDYQEDAVPTRISSAEAGNLMDIGIRDLYTEDHDMFRSSVRRFFNEEVKPNIMRFEKQQHVDRELWLKAGEQGLLGCNTPAEHGGIGADILYANIVWEEQGYVNDTGCGFALHSDIVMPYISHFGSPEQIEEYIPALTSGEKIGCIAMTEPGAGSDLQGVRTNAVQDGDDWIINGSKVFITNGWMSDVALVVCVTNPKARSAAHGISLFLVDRGTPGYVQGKPLIKMGLKAQDTAELFFEDCRVPKSKMLGEPNKGFYYLMQELPQERLLIGCLALSNCEWMFEETRNYVNGRKAFGKTIGALQVTQHKLAEMKTNICIGRAFADNCLKIHSERGLDSISASMAKYWLTDLQNKVAYDCVQLHGGWGYMWEYPISHSYVDARVQTIYGGTNEIMKELISRPIVNPK